jgi:class 3 adenylate cyclase
VAYQVTGSGPNLLVQPDWLTSLDLDDSYWRPREFLERLNQVGRVIRIDARGAGLSDSVIAGALPTAEEIADDAVSVLEAVQAEDVIVVASNEGALLAMAFAASHPDKVRGLILVNASARFSQSDDYDIGFPHEFIEATLQDAKERWGAASTADLWNPNMANDPEYIKWFKRWERTAAGPSVAHALFRMIYLDLDMRAVLPTISAPTLVLHRRECIAIPFSHGEFLAKHIPDARLVSLDGADVLLWGVGSDDVLTEIEEFVTGVRPLAEPDRFLATVLFTDIVDSTATVVEHGDSAWRALLDRHDAISRREVQRHRGNVIKSTGDGLLATFDGPARAIRCAVSVRDALRPHGLRIRAGLHTGEIEHRGHDIGGVAVHAASRVQSHAQPDEILVSRTTTDLVAGSAIEFEDRGSHILKGIPGDWPLFAVSRT